MSRSSVSIRAARRATCAAALAAATAAVLVATAPAAESVPGAPVDASSPATTPALDAAPTFTPEPSPAPETGAPSSPIAAQQATDPGALIPLTYAVDGFGEVRTGIRGKVTIAGTFTGTYDAADGSITGGFDLTPTRAHVTALGFLPVVAETDWSFTEPVRGSWRDGVLRLRIAAKIRHPRMWAFGIQVAGGPDCATREPSIIELASPADPAARGPEAGGTLSTVAPGFAISGLTGCGPLTGFLSAVAAGGGNRAALTFTGRPAA